MKKTDKYYSTLVKDLKTTNYCDALTRIQNDLGLRQGTKFAEVEVLLLFAVSGIYNSINADVALMALGLLKGFSNQQITTESTNPREPYSQRRDKLIFDTNYNKVFYKGKKIPELYTIRGTLDTNTGRYLQKVISRLYSTEKINDYLNAAKREFEENIAKKRSKKLIGKHWSIYLKNCYPICPL